jgi:hypothetical protein
MAKQKPIELPLYFAERFDKITNDEFNHIKTVIKYYEFLIDKKQITCDVQTSNYTIFNNLYEKIPLENIKEYYKSKFTEIKTRIDELFSEKSEKSTRDILSLVQKIKEKCDTYGHDDSKIASPNCSNYKIIIHSVQPDETRLEKDTSIFEFEKLTKVTDIQSLIINTKKSRRLKRILILFVLNETILLTPILYFFREVHPLFKAEPEEDNHVDELVSMGFSKENVVRALRATGNNPEYALKYYLLTGITPKEKDEDEVDEKQIALEKEKALEKKIALENLQRWATSISLDLEQITIGVLTEHYTTIMKEYLSELALSLLNRMYLVVEHKKKLEQFIMDFINNYDINRSLSKAAPQNYNIYFSFLYLSNKTEYNANYIEFDVFDGKTDRSENTYSLSIKNYVSDFERSDTIYAPPFNVFSLKENNLDFFTFFHELGHNLEHIFRVIGAREVTFINMNDDKITIHGKGSAKYKENIRTKLDAIERRLIDTPETIKLTLIQQLIKDLDNGTGANKIKDIMADYFSSTLLLNHLIDSYQSNPECVIVSFINTMKELTGDGDHMETKIRLIINIIFSDTLKDLFLSVNLEPLKQQILHYRTIETEIKPVNFSNWPSLEATAAEAMSQLKDILVPPNLSVWRECKNKKLGLIETVNSNVGFTDKRCDMIPQTKK